MIKCKSCGKLDKNYAGFCQKCYNYFIKNGFRTYKEKVEYGKMSYVDNKNDKQYSMPICHICGKAYTKLQQHIYYHKAKQKNHFNIFLMY